MSDALTDIARDKERAERIKKYLEAIRDFLKDPTKERRSAVLARAAEADAVRRGYFSGKTNFSAEVARLLDGLIEGNKEVWAKFLFRLEGLFFQTFKNLSPFKGKTLVQVDYGSDAVSFEGDRCRRDIEAFAYEHICKRNGLMTYDYDKYLLVLDGPDSELAEVFWCGCGILGQNEPRKAK